MAGHPETRDTSDIIKFAKKRTLRAAMDVFRKHKEYIWEQRKKHKFEKGSEIDEVPRKPPKPPKPRKGNLVDLWGGKGATSIT